MADYLPISVIIPHRNRSIVSRAIESVRRQTAPPAEIIVVDDASLPEYRQALHQHAAGARIVYLDRRHGPAAAKNAGIEAASQKWVALLDDDDEWLPNKLERQWQILSSDPSLSAVSSAMTVVSDGGPTRTMGSHTPTIMTLEAALEGTVAMTQTMVIRTADMRALGGFDASMVPVADREFWIRFTQAGYRGYFDREPLAILNRRRMQRVTGSWLNNVRGHWKLVEKHRDLFEMEAQTPVRQARSKGLRRVGLERGAVLGRLIYSCGCVYGGHGAALLELMFTGKMPDVPYSRTLVPSAKAFRTGAG
jgi:glycosyltransferase involved in cell wall biosynthesis